MLIVSYDISNNRIRTKFAKFLVKFGYRLQYSVFAIKNSERILKIITSEITNNFEKSFDETDSVIIFHFDDRCKKTCFGYARNDDEDLIIIT